MTIWTKVPAEIVVVFKIGIMFPATTKAFDPSIIKPIKSVTCRLFLKNYSYNANRIFLLNTSNNITRYPNNN